MPAKSQAQREYLNAKFGHEWVKEHHFDNKGKLPAKAKKVGGRSAKPDPKPVSRAKKKSRRSK